MAKKCDMAKAYAFISYCHRDSESVIPVVQKLSDVVNIWWDDEMRIGDRWDVDKAIPAIENENCKYLISFVSSDYLVSDPCRREVETAKDKNKKIIPVLFENRTPKEIVDELKKKLDELPELADRSVFSPDDLKESIGYAIRNIMGSEESYTGNKKLYITIQDDKVVDKLSDAVDDYVPPRAYLRGWLKNSTDNFITINGHVNNMYSVTDKYNDAVSRGVEDSLEISNECTSKSAFILIARLKYALEHEGAVMPYPEEDNAANDLVEFYGFQEDMFDYTISLGDFLDMLYCTVTNGITTLDREHDMHYANISDPDERINKVVDFFMKNGIINEGVDPADEIFEIDGFVNITVAFMKLLERNYAGIINKYVFNMTSDD